VEAIAETATLAVRALKNSYSVRRMRDLRRALNLCLWQLKAVVAISYRQVVRYYTSCTATSKRAVAIVG
jgi:hypothetical protein